ncbi:MAG: hypothetical protein M9888_12320 [Chitinophagales bacterium]|nr:hypothetical protein [Chitinophagales bacterium]
MEWYTDMTVYKFISKDLDENGKVMKVASKKPTVFILSGEAFVKLDNQSVLNPDYGNLHSSLKLATKLTHGGDYNVIWIRYDTATGTDRTKIDKLFELLQFKHPNDCSYTNGTESKARLEYASLAAFSDFRKKI